VLLLASLADYFQEVVGTQYFVSVSVQATVWAHQKVDPALQFVHIQMHEEVWGHHIDQLLITDQCSPT
jgi:hypothetical protein